jgi:hypothetical protein
VRYAKVIIQFNFNFNLVCLLPQRCSLEELLMGDLLVALDRWAVCVPPTFKH